MIFKLTRIRNGKQVDQDGKLIQKGSWSGMSTYTGCTVKITPEIGKNGFPVTGLTSTEARKLEKELFMREGELDHKSDYWTDGKNPFLIPFPPQGITLDDEDPDDKLRLAVLRSMKKVANGREELTKKSKAEYILTSDAKIEEEDDDRFSHKETAYGALAAASPAKLKQLYSVLAKQKKGGVVVDTSSMTDLAIKNGLRKAIEANAQFFNEIEQDVDLGVKAEIIELVTNRVLSTNSSGYYDGSDLLAFSLEDMVSFMNNPHNQPRVIQLKQKLKGKNKKS